ncbi:MAG: response regulator [Chloroflexi bacterium]|nr:response regulator [Chloroflexota bacterium]
MKLLIVEDDLALSDVLRFTLRRAGFEVLLAHDGRQALAQWERENPELILLDLNLPKLDGLAVCRHIRAQSQTPIIMLSVRGGDEAVVQGLEMGRMITWSSRSARRNWWRGCGQCCVARATPRLRPACSTRPT